MCLLLIQINTKKKINTKYKKYFFLDSRKLKNVKQIQRNILFT
jgi:hypothetical protein